MEAEEEAAEASKEVVVVTLTTLCIPSHCVATIATSIASTTTPQRLLCEGNVTCTLNRNCNGTYK